tara:strand:+ start:1475 stop:2194 length:720 start_codon:yes stop_codon:yes gene_type:complete
MAKITLNYSPNFSPKRRISKNIKYLIIHYTGMKDEKKAIHRLTDKKSKVSCHYFIKINGEIILLVPESYIAWHAGVSSWKNKKSLNKFSIGIEIHNKGHDHGYSKFTEAQINSTIVLCKKLIKKYKISNNNILGHSDIAYNRKKDPGEKFPWKKLANNKIGKWHNLDQKKLIRLRGAKISSSEKKNMLKKLKKIGYLIKSENHKLIKLIKAFQRRFRPELINGKIDKECLEIVNKISNL